MAILINQLTLCFLMCAMFSLPLGVLFLSECNPSLKGVDDFICLHPSIVILHTHTHTLAILENISLICFVVNKNIGRKEKQSVKNFNNQIIEN